MLNAHALKEKEDVKNKQNNYCYVGKYKNLPYKSNYVFNHKIENKDDFLEYIPYKLSESSKKNYYLMSKLKFDSLSMRQQKSRVRFLKRLIKKENQETLNQYHFEQRFSTDHLVDWNQPFSWLDFTIPSIKHKNILYVSTISSDLEDKIDNLSSDIFYYSFFLNKDYIRNLFNFKQGYFLNTISQNFVDLLSSPLHFANYETLEQRKQREERKIKEGYNESFLSEKHDYDYNHNIFSIKKDYDYHNGIGLIFSYGNKSEINIHELHQYIDLFYNNNEEDIEQISPYSKEEKIDLIRKTFNDYLKSVLFSFLKRIIYNIFYIEKVNDKNSLIEDMVSTIKYSSNILEELMKKQKEMSVEEKEMLNSLQNRREKFLEEVEKSFDFNTIFIKFYLLQSFITQNKVFFPYALSQNGNNTMSFDEICHFILSNLEENDCIFNFCKSLMARDLSVKEVKEFINAKDYFEMQIFNFDYSQLSYLDLVKTLHSIFYDTFTFAFQTEIAFIQEKINDLEEKNLLVSYEDIDNLL